ncbi:Threonyl/alanyl tRNA synthetase SAD, partial [sediment metagenome]
MKTTQVYYEDPYKTTLRAKVLSVVVAGNLFNVILDQTIFYPEGGGQPSDRGTIGNTKIEYVRMVEGEIIHQVKGPLKAGEEVECTLDWNWRYKHMKIHAAGHILHDVLMTLAKDLTPLKGSHGKKAFIEYFGVFDPQRQKELEDKVNETINQDLTVVTKESSYEELEKE